MFISFVSPTGSYSGSSIYYWAIYDFHDDSTDGDRIDNTLCDEEFSSPTGVIRSPKNTLLFKDPAEEVVCNYNIGTKSTQFSRISLKINDTNFKSVEKKCKKCWENEAFDRIEVVITKME